MAESTEKKKLKILCIHGYRQNAKSFRERTGAFRKIPIIKNSTDLVFITAPNEVPNPVEGSDDKSTTDQMGWWFSNPDRTYMAQDYTACCEGYQESLNCVEEVFKQQGPFDGILSFSQGASFVSLLCGIQQQNPESPIKFDFAILVAGFKSRQSAHESLYSVPINVPSLHVFGDTDQVIQKDMSEDLLKYFVDPKVLEHEGGHFIPVASAQKKIYTKFLKELLDKKLDKQ